MLVVEKEGILNHNPEVKHAMSVGRQVTSLATVVRTDVSLHSTQLAKTAVLLKADIVTRNLKRRNTIVIRAVKAIVAEEKVWMV